MGGIQVSIADLEDRLLDSDWKASALDRPVFIAGLPRSGTTLLLNLLYSSGEFASHIYRDMPFVLCPVIWSRFTEIFRVVKAPRERAHADGLTISADSPEAFEEMVWHQFWPEKYKSKWIEIWGNENYGDFEAFLTGHLKKIVMLRKSIDGGSLRYLSKNNLNTSRIGYLKRVFPDSKIIVPFRDPLQQAASMLSQHVRFSKMHKEDAFAKQYMKRIGHFEFGANLKPIDFQKWYSRGNRVAGPETIEFWIRYWIEAYSYLYSQVGDGVKLLSFCSLTRRPQSVLESIGEYVGLENPQGLIRHSDSVKIPVDRDVDASGIDRSLLGRAFELLADLEKEASD